MQRIPPVIGLDGRIVRVMLGCPSDIEDEVAVFTGEICLWNQEHAEEYAVSLVPKHWSTHTHPRLDDRPQGVVNSQLTTRADVLVAVFWTRLGSDTGEAESGTVEEIRAFHRSGRPVKLYFSDAPVPAPKLADHEFVKEYERVKKFREEARKLGVHGSYTGVDDFKRQLRSHLLMEVRQLRDSGLIPPHHAQPSPGVANEVSATVATLRRTVRSLRLDWNAERDSSMGNYNKGKFIMARLNHALATHLAELADYLSEEQLRPLETCMSAAKEVEQSLPTMGSEFHEWFWGVGSEVFSELGKAINSVSEP